MNLQQTIIRILKEETEDGMKDILFDMFDENTKGYKIYNYNDLVWMILPKEKKWVFYMNSEGTLWCNYKFFKKIYKYVSLDIVDDKQYITKWVEDILKTNIRHTQYSHVESNYKVGDVLKMGKKIIKEETEDGMKDIMFDIFDENTKGAELYKYDNSLWMILPEQKEWVIEIDIDLTLWYNYGFFKKIYKYVSLDAVDNKHYITEWVEDILKTGIRHTRNYGFESRFAVEDIIKKGKKG